MNKDRVLGVDITTSSDDEILKYITTRLQNIGKKWFIVTPNPEMLVLASQNFEFKAILNKADIALPDGMGLVVAAKLLGKGVKRRITGVDMVYKVCEMMSREGLTAGFLGGEKGVAVKTAECLIKLYPELRVIFAGSEWPEDWFMHKINSKVIRQLADQKSKLQLKSQKLNNNSEIQDTKYSKQQIDMLFVAFGFPKQEKWIYENLDKIPVLAAMGVGGAFDYISGKVPRAPQFIRYLGFEWLYRLIVEPWRWRRQLALGEFGWMVLKEVWRKKLKVGA